MAVWAGAMLTLSMAHSMRWRSMFARHRVVLALVLAPAMGCASAKHEQHVSSPGVVSGPVIFRHQRSRARGILKIKGELASRMDQGMRAPLGVRCKTLAPSKCKRMGHSVVVSTQNPVDPVVVEFRLSPAGEIVDRSEDFRLYHSLAANREYGQGSFAEGELRITGDAAAGLIAFWNAERAAAGKPALAEGPVVLRLEDMATGRWVVEHPTF